MTLNIYKFKTIPKKEELNSNYDTLFDLAIVYDIGFKYENNNRYFFKDVFFCFHYCIDKYNKQTNVSFNILMTNEQTNSYCYFKESQSFFNEKISLKKIDVENINLNLKKTNFNIDQNKKLFNEIINLIKNDLIEEQKNNIIFFKENNINYEEKEVNEFHKIVNFNFEKYLKKVEDYLKNFIIEYDKNTLSTILEIDEDQNKKNKLKI